MSLNQRIQAIRTMLSTLGNLRPLLPSQPETVFEFQCYLDMAIKIALRNKAPMAINVLPGDIFRPHFKPGNMFGRSYFRFSEPDADDICLFMNCSVRKKTEVRHAPDIVMANDSETLYSIYECKNYSGRLGVGAYREFMGYLMDLGFLPSNGQQKSFLRVLPEFSPCIFTTATALGIHAPLLTKYGFLVEDRL